MKSSSTAYLFRMLYYTTEQNEWETSNEVDLHSGTKSIDSPSNEARWSLLGNPPSNLANTNRHYHNSIPSTHRLITLLAPTFLRKEPEDALKNGAGSGVVGTTTMRQRNVIDEGFPNRNRDDCTILLLVDTQSIGDTLNSKYLQSEQLYDLSSKRRCWRNEYAFCDFILLQKSEMVHSSPPSNNEGTRNGGLPEYSVSVAVQIVRMSNCS
ncbi:hypothetical protein WUBG_07600 [Wuchereria bancrofti]|uniref:Uncharacterized protein n=1 Tax=Wuchereria bancrofti TaxID=6293 RepID=J9EH56_WUCBA|nr:hypothetical protein WUBG_07600 [Wuchereria bancrofti]